MRLRLLLGVGLVRISSCLLQKGHQVRGAEPLWIRHVPGNSETPLELVS